MISEEREWVQNWLDGQPEGLQLESGVSPPSETASFPSLPEPDGEELTQEEADMLNARFQGRLRGRDGTCDRICENATSLFTRVQSPHGLLKGFGCRRQHMQRNRLSNKKLSASGFEEHKGHTTPAVNISNSMEHARGQRKRRRTNRQHDFCMPYSYTSTCPQPVAKHIYPRFSTLSTPHPVHPSFDYSCLNITSSTVRIAKGPAGLRLRSSV
jgi:hypothetical protein